MEVPKKSSALWKKAIAKLGMSPEKEDEPRTVNTDWATFMAQNVSDAFKMPVQGKLKLKKALNMSINIPNLLEDPLTPMDMMANNTDVIPFRPKSDFNAKEIINADYFKDGYDARNFVEKIHANCESKNDPGKSIKAVTEELLKIKKKVKKKIEDQEDAFNATEISRRKKMEDIRAIFKEVKLSYASIEGELRSVAKTAMQIGKSEIGSIKGDQLDIIDKQRSRATDARDLIQFFVEFKHGNTSRLDELKASGVDGERKSAVIARRLMNLSKDMDIYGMDDAKANVEKYCEVFETEFLSKFDEARTLQDYDQMNRYAKVLSDFNGGTSCIQMYINQHDFFIQRVMEDVMLAEESSQSNTDPTVVPSNILRLYEDVEKCCVAEWEVISLVFPNPTDVMQQFIQRIFAQSIQISLETIIENAKRVSELNYLITLQTLHSKTRSLVLALHKFDEDVIAKSVKKPAMTFVLNHSFEVLFIPYLEGDRYIKVEHSQLNQSFSPILKPVHELYQNHRKLYRKNKNGSISLISTRDALTNLTVNQLVDLMSPSGKTGTDSITMEINSIIQILRNHSSAVNRCKELCHPLLLPRQAGSLFILLSNTIGNQYINLMLEMYFAFANNRIMNELETTDLKAEPNFKFLPIVNTINHITSLLHIHFQQNVISVVSRSQTVLRDMIFYKNELISSMETKVNAILIKTIYIATNRIESLLSKQKKTDFKPKEELSNIDIDCTLTCRSVLEFIENLKFQISTYFDSQNHDCFLAEIGANFCRLLFDHFQKFPTNHIGGVIITKDIQKYNESMSLLGISLLTERFDLLREMGSLFIVKPENMRTMIQEGNLGRIDFKFLKPYLQMRWDWSRISKLLEEN